MARSVVALAQAFGHRGNLPGTSNEHLAQLIRDHYSLIDFLMVQVEIRNALQPYWILPQHTVRSHRLPGRYLDTAECLDQMILHHGLERLRQSELWVFCHRTHIRYLRILLSRRGLAVSRWIVTGRYDRLSHQWWTRDPVRCNLYKAWQGFRYLLSGKFDLKLPRP